MHYFVFGQSEEVVEVLLRSYCMCYTDQFVLDGEDA
jgi:hypothetical protein